MSLGARGSNGRASKQDYTNLLYSDSESDGRIPDLKLPPVKGKKQKKKRGSVGYRQEETSCGIWSVMKVFLLLVLLAAVAALAGVCFWSLQKINSLQEKVDRLQRSDAFTPDSMTKFQTQLMSLNKSLTELRMGAGGTKALTASVEVLKTKVKNFEQTSVELNKAIASSKELLDLPHKVDDLTSMVATLKNDASKTQKHLEAEIDALQKQREVTQSPNTGSSEATMSQTKSVVTLTENVKLLNQTMSQSFANVERRLNEQETKTTTIEDFIKKSATASPFKGEDINKFVEEALHSALENMTNMESLGQMMKQMESMVQEIQKMGNSTNPGFAPNEGIEEAMKQLGTIMEEVEALKSNQEESVSQGDFILFKENVIDDIKSINKTLMMYNDEFEELLNHVSGLESNQKNISSFIEAFASRLQGELFTNSSKTTLSPSTKDTHQKANDETNTGDNSEQIPSEEDQEESTSKPKVHTGSTTSMGDHH